MENVLKSSMRKSPKLWLLISLCAFIIAYILILNYSCRIAAGDIILFFVAQAAFVLLPGMCLLLYINPPKSAANYLIVSYMLGIGIMILQAFLYGALHITWQSIIGMSIICGLSVWGIYKRREQFFELFRNENITNGFSLLILTAAVLIITAVLGTSAYNSPDLTANSTAYIYHDLLWNVGNTVSLANGLPVEDIHISGFTFGYHYFINAFLAPFYNTLNISAFNLYVKLLPSVAVTVLCGGFYIFIGSLFKNKAVAALFSFAALLCCTYTVSHLLWYAYATPASMGISLGAAYYFIKLFKKIGSIKIYDRDFITFLLLVITATGIKTLLAAAVIAGAGITLLAQLIIKRKNVKNILSIGLIILAAVAAIYFSLIYGTHTYNGLSRAFGSMMWMGGEPWYYASAIEFFSGLPLTAVRAITYPFYLIVNYPLCVISIIALIVCLIKKRGDFYTPLFLLSGIIVGLGAASVIYQPGMSNIFFAEGALPLCVYALLFIIIKCGLKKTAGIFIGAVTAVTFAYSAYLSLTTLAADYSSGLPYRSRESIGSPYDTITAEQFEGTQWLRQNTQRDDIFASDHIYYTPNEVLSDARFYYYTAFSERPNYIEGYNYISTHTENFEEVIADKLDILSRVYQNDEDAVKSLYDSGVKYLVATRFFHPDFVLNSDFGTEVFSNNDIAVYKLEGLINS